MKKIIILFLVVISLNLHAARLTLDTSRLNFSLTDENVYLSYPSLYFTFENDYFSLSNLTYNSKLQSLISPNKVFLEKMSKKSVYGLNTFGLSLSFKNLSFFVLTKEIKGLSIVYENKYLRIGSSISKSFEKKDNPLFFDPSYSGNKLILNNTIQHIGTFYQISLSSSHSINLKPKLYISLSLFYKDVSIYYLRGDINTIEMDNDVTREAFKLSIDNKVFKTEILIKRGADPLRPKSYRSQSYSQKTRLKIDKYFLETEYDFVFNQNGKLTKKYNLTLRDEYFTIKTDNKLNFSLEFKIKDLVVKYKKGEIEVGLNFKIEKDFMFKINYSSKGIFDTSIIINF